MILFYHRDPAPHGPSADHEGCHRDPQRAARRHLGHPGRVPGFGLRLAAFHLAPLVLEAPGGRVPALRRFVLRAVPPRLDVVDRLVGVDEVVEGLDLGVGGEGGGVDGHV